MIDLSKVHYSYLIAELQRRVGNDITYYYINDVIEWIKEKEENDNQT